MRFQFGDVVLVPFPFLEQISQLPRAKQRFVIEMLDTVLQQTG